MCALLLINHLSKWIQHSVCIHLKHPTQHSTDSKLSAKGSARSSWYGVAGRYMFCWKSETYCATCVSISTHYFFNPWSRAGRYESKNHISRFSGWGEMTIYICVFFTKWTKCRAISQSHVWNDTYIKQTKMQRQDLLFCLKINSFKTFKLKNSKYLINSRAEHRLLAEQTWPNITVFLTRYSL